MNHFSPIRLSITVQLSVSVLLSFLALLIGQVQAVSVFVGTLIFMLSNLYFTHYAFRYRFQKGNIDLIDWIHRSIMWGHMGKLSLATLGFALVFRFVEPLDALALFGGYIAMIFTQWWLGQKIATQISELQRDDSL